MIQFRLSYHSQIKRNQNEFQQDSTDAYYFNDRNKPKDSDSDANET